MSFARPGRVVSALLTLVAVTAAASCGKPDLDIEHKTLDKAPESITRTGPAPGRYELAWKKTIDEQQATPGNATDAPQARLIGGTVITTGPAGVTAYDANSGKPTWHYREPDRSVRTAAFADGVVVLKTAVQGEEVPDDAVEHVIGLDGQTGERLWEKFDQKWTLRADGHAGVVTVEVGGQDTGSTKFAGVEARTGKERWSLKSGDLGDGCRPKKQRATVSKPHELVGLTFECDDFGPGEPAVPEGIDPTNVPRLYAVVDAASGAAQWVRATDLERDQATLNGYTVWSKDKAPPVVFDPRGRPVYRGPAGSECIGACTGIDLGSSVAFEVNLESPDKTAVEIDVDANRARVTDPDDYGRPAVGENGALVDVTGPRSSTDTAPIRAPQVAQRSPVGSPETVDIVTGDDPVKDRDIAVLGEDRPNADSSTSAEPSERTKQHRRVAFAATKNRIFTWRNLGENASPSGDFELAAYELKHKDGKGENGGVSTADWPEPCTLLKGAALPEDLREATRHPGTKRTVGDLTVPATACELNSVPLVRVDEVLPTENDAKAAFPGSTDSRDGDVDADDAMLDDEWGSHSRYYIRVGRYIASVADTEMAKYDVEERDRLVKLTNAVAKNLRAFAAAR